jgi:hypothetical protein
MTLCQRRRLLSVHINAYIRADWHRDGRYSYWKGTRFEFQQRACYNYLNFKCCPEFVWLNIRIFIFPLFNYALSIWSYLTSNGKPTNKYEVERIWKEASMYLVSMLQFAWRDSRKKLLEASVVPRSSFEPFIYRKEVQNYYKLSNFLGDIKNVSFPILSGTQCSPEQSSTNSTINRYTVGPKGGKNWKFQTYNLPVPLTENLTPSPTQNL